MTMTNPFRLRRTVLVAAAFASLLALSCKEGATASGRATPGSRVDFQLKALDGRTLGPKDFLGQVVVVDFWATWCGPCHLQAEILEPLYRDLKGRGVQFLAVNVGEEPETVKSFLKSKPFHYPVLLDTPDQGASNIGGMATPT